ncbi:MAG: hypothetical protein NWF08_05585 [Candidatus Bathyarchaeota archaeon]|nr:hypothetical protein [Candidatus Bathyarchaeota archaeon]
MKNAILAGAIAGAVADPALVVSGYVFGNIGIFEPPGGLEIWTLSMFILLVLAHLSLDIFWGMIGGAAFSYLYNLIPGKGAVKGLYFGLSIWVIKDVAAGSYLALTMMEVNSAILLIIPGFFLWIVYGPMLGYLYKPSK